jgi:hypothetical protein
MVRRFPQWRHEKDRRLYRCTLQDVLPQIQRH